MPLDVETAQRLTMLETQMLAQMEAMAAMRLDGVDRSKRQELHAREISEKLQGLTDAAHNQQGFIKGFKFAVGAFWLLTGGVIVAGVNHFLGGGLPR